MNIQDAVSTKCFLQRLVICVVFMAFMLSFLWFFCQPSLLTKTKAISTYELLNIAYVDAQLRLRSPKWNESDANNFIKISFLMWLSVDQTKFEVQSKDCFVYKGRSNPEISTGIAKSILLNDPLGIAHHGDAVIHEPDPKIRPFGS
jgi:hypothetical protein